jgi:TetR/AcrR family transcriptional regulator, tetracycline repressor protein
MARSGQAAGNIPPAKGAPAVRRAPWGSISRAEIVQAAVGVVAAGGYEELSIRRLAAQLGVSPMALYRHIRDKDDLLDEVVDILLAAAWMPAAAESDWQAWIIEAATKLREFLVTQPAGLHVYLRHPVVSPAALKRMNAMMGVLRQAGLDEETARSAYGALHTYTIGFAALEASRSGWVPGDGDVSNLAQQLAAYSTAGQFMEGLHYLLAGIGREVKEGRQPGR